MTGLYVILSSWKVRRESLHTSCKIETDLLDRIANLLSGTETVSQFVYRATREKVTRMESRDERARLQILDKNRETLEPIIESILKKYGLI